MAPVYEFEWDEINEAHLAERGISNAEADQVLSNRHLVVPNRKHQGRMLLVGMTDGGRVLILSIEPTRIEGTWRPITARDAEPEECEQLRRRT